ncbi:MAG TPA: Rrf2 family transcriptional regulator [Candidatus Bathyarchaeia archaeon]|nr:Rrf2 family transcriptional regulator [Candidatus Bathyarchaeia archaeon]
MKISSKGEYALRALLVLGQHEGKVLSIADISDKTLVPISYLEQILLQLKMLGHVKSKRGSRGGYSLRTRPADVNIGDVIRRLEGPLAPMGCASITSYEPCILEPACLLKPLWTRIRDTVAQILEETTLADLLDRRFNQ